VPTVLTAVVVLSTLKSAGSGAVNDADAKTVR
jgi:hypothetical protein